jgi:uncharacterized protein (DUF427 family)
MSGRSVTPSSAHVRATWKGKVLADSSRTLLVEGNHYFPPEDVERELLTASDEHTHCPWKGEASYYNVVVGEDINPGAAWYYPEPMEAAAPVRDHVAFWRGVDVAVVG